MSTANGGVGGIGSENGESGGVGGIGSGGISSFFFLGAAGFRARFGFGISIGVAWGAAAWFSAASTTRSNKDDI